MKFRQQHVIDRFIVDFCSIEDSLIIEVDGQIHDEQIEYDADRTKILEQYGYQVLRFRNEEIFEDIENVTSQISNALKSPPLGGRGAGDRKV